MRLLRRISVVYDVSYTTEFRFQGGHHDQRQFRNQLRMGSRGSGLAGRLSLCEARCPIGGCRRPHISPFPGARRIRAAGQPLSPPGLAGNAIPSRQPGTRMAGIRNHHRRLQFRHLGSHDAGRQLERPRHRESGSRIDRLRPLFRGAPPHLLGPSARVPGNSAGRRRVAMHRRDWRSSLWRSQSRSARKNG